ncbi:putative disease resistance protein RGA3 [Lolium rigidum]|uniref:putative disease resistance protein RGA3 n=1 Tax=Lolium rigidum TaxID=89674 RepID=UPI001F5DDF60|nr:putative disease resistance protein RGA3 [Lolium rigidum]
MEPLLSSIMGDLVGRALSMVTQRYLQSKGAQEEKLQRLRAILLRIEAIIEEAEGRHITNQVMLQQLQMMREDMYRGYYTLDAFRYAVHTDEAKGEVTTGSSFVLSRFSPSSSKRLFFSMCNTLSMDFMFDVWDSRNLDKMLGSIERMIGDMQELILFLASYPRVSRQPYNAYLLLDQVMFGRQMEKETIISFLFWRETTGNGKLGVLPVIGAPRVGKSTLVEHVCLNERVRDRFSLIVFLSGSDLKGGNLATLRHSGVIKHQKLASTSHGDSLAVIELAGDMDEETWRRLYTSAVKHMTPGSKIILTSRSDKIASFGTAQALTLKFLHQEAYWYFFKTIAFGSRNPEEHPNLAALGMEIAVHMNRSFMAANTVAGILRDNLDTQFWRKMLRCLRDFDSKHLSMFGEHPIDLLQKDKPVYIWTMVKTNNVVVMRNIYQERSPQISEVPTITAQDVLSGCVTSQGKFQAVAWRSRVPPCYTYLVSFVVSPTDKHLVLRKKRSRQERV